MQKQAVRAIGRRNRDEAIPVLIRIGRNHPKMPVRKQAIQTLGQTGDERAVALYRVVSQVNDSSISPWIHDPMQGEDAERLKKLWTFSTLSVSRR